MTHSGKEGRATLRKSGAILLRRLRSAVKEMDALREMVEAHDLSLEDLRVIYDYLHQLREPFNQLYNSVEAEGLRLYRERHPVESSLAELIRALSWAGPAHDPSAEDCSKCPSLSECEKGKKLIQAAGLPLPAGVSAAPNLKLN